MGEIVVRGNVVMEGYYNDPEATAKAFRGGWFHTGDAAVVHPDGYAEIRDRIKDVIISGGENISSVEVEGVLLRHPAVQEVAIVGLPDEKWGESPHAFVVLKPGATATEDGAARSSRATAWPTSRRRTASASSPSCRRPRPARSRNTSCAGRRRHRPAVGSRPARPAGATRAPHLHEVDAGGDGSADQWADDVEPQVRPRAAVEQGRAQGRAEPDRRVERAAGDRPCHEGHPTISKPIASPKYELPAVARVAATLTTRTSAMVNRISTVSALAVCTPPPGWIPGVCPLTR